MTDRDRAREAERALESCLDWAGDLQRRYDELYYSKTWQALLALRRARSPGALARLPADLYRILRGRVGAPGSLFAAQRVADFQPPPPGPLDPEKPLVVFVVPWLTVGGAEKVVLETMRGLREAFALAVVTTETARHLWRREFAALTPWIFALDGQGPQALGAFLRRLATEHGAKGFLISSTAKGYQALPALDETGVWVADILHNVAPEGHMGASIRQDRRIACHFVVARLHAQRLERAGVAARKVVVAPNTVDAENVFNPATLTERRGALRAEFGVEDEDIVLTTLARLSSEKDLPLFVDSLARMRAENPGLPMKGLIAGDGPERIRIERLIRDRNLESAVRVLGFTSRIAEVLAISDYFLLTSRVEGNPGALLEAMAMGLPTLAADVGGVSETLDDGVNGLLIRERTPGAFAAAFRRLQQNEAFRKALGEAARRTVLKRYRPEETLRVYRRVFEEALSPKPIMKR